MYLSILLGLFLFITSAHSEECLLGRDLDHYRSKEIVIDDVVFHLHFPDDRPWFTRKVISALEEGVTRANRYFESRPATDVHLVTIAASSANGFESNGMATVFPYNIITLNEFPPTGSNYLRDTDQWIHNLVIHEYIHILTMDMTNGWIKGLRKVFGSAVKTNGVIPRWLAEGVAVWFESLIPGQGRLNQKGVQFQVYQALSDKGFCQGISCLDIPMKYPYGHAPYWIGGEFVKYLEQIHPGFLRCVFKEHSEQVPFFLNGVFKTCVGMNVEDAYESFKKFYLKTHALSLKNYCPAKDQKICRFLEDNHIDESVVDFQTGICHKDDYLLYVKRDELGRNRFYPPHELELLNIKTGKRKTFKNSYPISVLEQTSGKCLLKESVRNGCSSSYDFLTIDLATMERKTLLEKSTALGVEFDKRGETVEVYYQDGLWEYKKEDKVLKNYRSETRPPFKEEDFSQDQKKLNIVSENYQGRKYFGPEYLLFNYSDYANLSALTLNTRLQDPLNAQALSLVLTNYFYKNSQIFGGNAAYSYLKNNYQWVAAASKSYFVSSLLDKLGQRQQASLGYNRFFTFSSWRLTSGGGLRLYSVNDFASDRNSKQGYFQMSWSQVRNNIFRNSKSLGFNYELSYNQVDSTSQEQFLAGQFHLNHSFYQGKNGEYGYSLNHGKYFKDNLKSGYLAAGGVNTFFANGYAFPLYMVSYANLIGNEVTTGNLRYKRRLFNHYKGYGILPLFLKDSGIEIGSEYAKGKYYFAADKLYKNDYVQGVYLRYYVSTKVAYIADATFSFAVAQTQYPSKVNSYYLFFNASAF